MQAFTEIVPPTGVTHAVSLSFTNPRSVNLVVAKTTLLQIFSIKSNADGTSKPKSQDAQQDAIKEPSHKLVFQGEYQLAGVVTSLARVKLPYTRSGCDSLLVSFRDAKMSLVEWDSEAQTLNTNSLHYYEGDDIGVDFFAADLSQYPTYTTLDPGGRCAALKFGPRSLAVLPLRHAGDDLIGEDESTAQAGGNNSAVSTQPKRQSPYKSSFVLPLTLLDPSLTHPVDVTFLYEYRDPTIGILSSSRDFAPHLNRKDDLTYTVFTLDLDARARTQLLSVSDLPSDLFKVVALPLPVGGSLLIGQNEIIHIDQAGKTHGVGVNDFAKQMSSFAMTDQSSLGLKLEHCKAVGLENASGTVLLVLADGRFVAVTFKMDGRLVAGLTVNPIEESRGGHLFQGAPTVLTILQADCIFIGSDETDSALIRLDSSLAAVQATPASADGSAHASNGADEDVEDEGMEDEDDLYGDVGNNRSTAAAASTISVSDLTFSLQDSLRAVIPTGEPTFATLEFPGDSKTVGDKTVAELEMAWPTSTPVRGELALLRRSISPRSLANFGHENVEDMWCFQVGVGDAQREHLILTTRKENRPLSHLILVDADKNEEIQGTDFVNDAATQNVGVLGNGSRVIQVMQSELRCYDADFALSQIIPMVDDDDRELHVIHTSFLEPFALVVRSNGSAILMKLDKNGDLEEVDADGAFVETSWTSGCLFCPPGSAPNSRPMAFMLSAIGGLQIYDAAKPISPLYAADSLAFCPFVLAPDRTERRAAAKATIKELLVTDLGDEHDKVTHMVIRTSNDDLIIYKPFHFPPVGHNQLFTKHLRWHKQQHGRICSTVGYYEAEDDPGRRMRVLENFCGLSAVLVPSQQTALLLKEASSRPRILSLDRDLSTISTRPALSSHEPVNRCFAITQSNILQDAIFSVEPGFGQTGLDVRRVNLGPRLDHVSFHPEADTYVAGVNEQTNFKLPDDDWHQAWTDEDISLYPQGGRGVIKLLDRRSCAVVDEYELHQEDEELLCLKVMNLEISEKTHERRNVVVAGTATIRGEDLAVMGAIYVFDILSVVPEPGRPETGHRLKLLVREEVRGAVTAMSETGSEGFIIAAQGQKCMVRGLKEDNTLLPIAFLDMQCYVTVMRSLPGTGLTLMGDALKGIRFSGFSPDPWKLQVFGKSKTTLEVISGELLPDGKQLLLLVADADDQLLVYEYNPEHPGSLKGQRLLKKSSFHVGHRVVGMNLLPAILPRFGPEDANGDVEMTDDSTASTRVGNQVLVTLRTGSMAVVSPLDEQQYRRLGAMQTHLTNILDHPCGMNPRAYRAVESEGFGGRGVLDGSLLRRWYDLSVQRQNEAGTRAGADRWQVKADLDAISGQGLGYL